MDKFSTSLQHIAVANVDMRLKPRATPEEIEQIAKEIAKQQPVAILRDIPVSAGGKGETVVNGHMRLKAMLDLTGSAHVRNQDTGEEFDVKRDANGNIVRAC